MQNRRLICHRFENASNVWQNFVVDFDECQCFRSYSCTRRGDRGNCVPVIQHLLARHQVLREMSVVRRRATFSRLGWRYLREIDRGNDGLHTGDSLGLIRINSEDARMSVRAAQDFANEHAGEREIGTECSASRYLIDTIRTYCPGSDPPVPVGISIHPYAPFASSATSRTDRIILS